MKKIPRTRGAGAALAQALLWIVLAGLALQVFFVGRIALMAWVDPQSTTFQRSEAWRLITTTSEPGWRQQWVPYDEIANTLKRAVIASEDSSFTEHDGVDWDAMEQAWLRNEEARQRAEQRAARLLARADGKPPAAAGKPQPTVRAPKVVGASTITQQLAKNLLLSGERTLLRKAQELVLTFALETLLSKQRILEIYLNNVEWGEGVFGAEAAAQHYFRKPAKNLSDWEAARLAVMLPRPRHYEKSPRSAFLTQRAATIVSRMGQVEAP